MTSLKLSVDDLLSRRIVHGPIVEIPGFDKINKSMRDEILDRLQYASYNLETTALTIRFFDLQRQECSDSLKPEFDPEALHDRLLDLTPPPPTKEEMMVEFRDREIEARRKLEAEGVPPCYPPSLGIPLQNVPEPYHDIIEYWRLVFAVEYGILEAQLGDWKDFRCFQRKGRKECSNRDRLFSEYVDKLRKRRQRHGLQGDIPIRLSLDADDRRLEDWLEYQAYHIRFRIERFESELRIQEATKANLQGRVNDADAAISKEAAEILQFNQRTWKHQEKRLEVAQYFLRWTEQVRVAMVSENPTFTKELDGPNTAAEVARGPRVSSRRKKQSTFRPVLGDSAISKRSHTNPSKRHRRSASTNASNTMQLLAHNTPSTARRGRRQTVTHSQSSRFCQLASAEIITRSGRVSRPPEKLSSDVDSSQLGPLAQVNPARLDNSDAEHSSFTSNSPALWDQRAHRPAMDRVSLPAKSKGFEENNEPANAPLGPLHSSKVSKAAGKRKGPQRRLSSQKIASNGLPVSPGLDAAKVQLSSPPASSNSTLRRSPRIRASLPDFAKDSAKSASTNSSKRLVRTKPELNAARSPAKPWGVSKKRRAKTQGKARKH